MVAPTLEIAEFYTKQSTIYKIFGLQSVPKNTDRSLKLAYQIHFWHVLIFWVLLYDCMFLIQFFCSIHSLNEVLDVFSLFATTVSVLAKFLSVKIKNQSYAEIFESMSSQEFSIKDGAEAVIVVKAIQDSRRVRNIYAFLSLIALNSMQYVTEKGQLPGSLYVPIDITVTWKYWSVYIYQYFALLLCCLTNIAFDSLSSSLFIYLKGQLEILAYRLEHVGESVSQDIVNKQLKDCIIYYYKIIHSAKRIEDVVTVPMSVQIACSILVLISNFYAMTLLSEPDDYTNILRFLIYQLCMLLQIFILCFFCNEIALQSIDLPASLYKSNWMYWDKRNRRLMFQMLLHLSNPIRINTVNRCYSFNLASFTSIVNSAYSYFALLKNMNSKQ